MHKTHFQNPHYSVAIPVFSQFTEIQAVYLFGSQASGNVHVESDIDFGFMADTNCKDRLETKLIEVGFYNFSLVYIPSEPIFHFSLFIFH
jgi:predicted nucleotidyltransferase